MLDCAIENLRWWFSPSSELFFFGLFFPVFGELLSAAVRERAVPTKKQAVATWSLNEDIHA